MAVPFFENWKETIRNIPCRWMQEIFVIGPFHERGCISIEREESVRDRRKKWCACRIRWKETNLLRMLAGEKEWEQQGKMRRKNAFPDRYWKGNDPYLYKT